MFAEERGGGVQMSQQQKGETLLHYIPSTS